MEAKPGDELLAPVDGANFHRLVHTFSILRAALQAWNWVGPALLENLGRGPGSPPGQLPPRR